MSLQLMLQPMPFNEQLLICRNLLLLVHLLLYRMVKLRTSDHRHSEHGQCNNPLKNCHELPLELQG
jgi:hypothetical protein